MLLFSINRIRGYENPSLDIIVIECFSIGGFPLKEACEHCYLNQVLFLLLFCISFMCIVKIMLDILLIYCHFQHFVSVLYILYIWYLAKFKFPSKDKLFLLFLLSNKSLMWEILQKRSYNGPHIHFLFMVDSESNSNLMLSCIYTKEAWLERE